jgi:hypothetical protein
MYVRYWHHKIGICEAERYFWPKKSSLLDVCDIWMKVNPWDSPQLANDKLYSK